MENKCRSVSTITIVDVLALLFVYMIPMFSRWVSFPLYLVDPMRLAILGILFVTRSCKNALMMALIIPLFSFFAGGHPVFPKCLLISGELIVNILLFIWTSSKISGRFVGSTAVSMFSSIFISKVLYYIVKALLISHGALMMDLFSTEFEVQLVVAALISIFFELFAQKR